MEVMAGSIAEDHRQPHVTLGILSGKEPLGPLWSGFQEAQWVELWALYIADPSSDSCPASIPAT